MSNISYDKVVFSNKKDYILTMKLMQKTIESLFKGNKYKHKIKNFITDLILSVDFTLSIKSKKYKIGFWSKNGCNGVLIDYQSNQEWEWCWMNSLNTHYSSFYLVILWLNKKYNQELFNESSFFSSNIDETLKLLFELLERHKQEIYTPGSTIFRDIFFSCQSTWNVGLISNLNVPKYIKPYFTVVPGSIDFERGNTDDFGGIDYKVFDKEGNVLSVQHKKTDLYTVNDYYKSDGFNYHNYYKNIDLFTIENGGYIYVFKNSNNKNILGMEFNTFYIHESLLLHKIKKMDENFSDLLITINAKCCYDLKYAFSLKQQDNDENNTYVLDVDKNLLVIYINNDQDPNLVFMFKEIINKLDEMKTKKEIHL